MDGGAGDAEASATAARGLVFAASVESAHRLAGFLRGCTDILNVEVLELTSRMRHKAQTTTFKAFQESSRAYVFCLLSHGSHIFTFAHSHIFMFSHFHTRRQMHTIFMTLMPYSAMRYTERS